MKLGFIGVGNIGAPIASQLLAAGHSLVVHDLRPEAAQGLLRAGAIWSDSAAALAAECEVVATCLPGPAEMEQVCLGPSGIVSVIKPGAKRVLYTGQIGSGSIAKIMHNSASFTLDLVMAECWTTGIKAGIDAATIVNVFNEAALGQMMSLKVRLPATWLRGNFEPRFSLALARKDLGLALELARATDTPMRLATICEQEMVDAVARGWADRDASIFLTLQEERAQIQVRLPPALRENRPFSVK